MAETQQNSGENSNAGDGASGQQNHDLTKEMNAYYMAVVKRHVHDNSSYQRVWKKYQEGNKTGLGTKRDNRCVVNFNEFDDKFLRLYKDRFKLNNLRDNYSLNGYLLQTELGSKTVSFRKNNKSTFEPKCISPKEEKESTPEEIEQQNSLAANNQTKYQTQKEKEKSKMLQLKENLDNTIIKGNRTSREELVREVETHFKDSYQVKETEAISQFIYKVRYDSKKFKLEF